MEEKLIFLSKIRIMGQMQPMVMVKGSGSSRLVPVPISSKI